MALLCPRGDPGAGSPPAPAGLICPGVALFWQPHLPQGADEEGQEQEPGQHSQHHPPGGDLLLSIGARPHHLRVGLGRDSQVSGLGSGAPRCRPLAQGAAASAGWGALTHILCAPSMCPGASPRRWLPALPGHRALGPLGSALPTHRSAPAPGGRVRPGQAPGCVALSAGFSLLLAGARS